MQDAELPTNWVLATNDDLGEFINGFAFKPADRTEHGTPIIRIQNLTDPLRPFNYTVKEVNQKYVVKRGNILVSWSATLDAFRWDGPRAYVNQHIFKVVPAKQLSSRFVFFALKESINELTNSEHLHGTTMKHVNRKPFLAHPVGLPPLNEQHRIVEKIETLFARINKGEEALREVQKLLKRYRHSILKAAVTGELTRDWREANQHKLEPASDLITRILGARRENWQGRGKYKEPLAPDANELPDLPIGWIWTTLDQLICHLTSGSRDWKKYYGHGDGTFIMAQNVRPARFEESYRLPVNPPEDGPDAIRSEARLDDLLITIVGANTGDICRFPLSEGKHYVCQSVALIRPSEARLSRYLELYLSAEEAGRKILDKFIYGAGRPHLSFEQLRSVPVPLPPLAEAAQITTIIEAFEAKMRKLDSEVSAQMVSASTLRQSILKSAFTGQLVPQDPDDEPASELLARIRAEREAAPKAKARRKARA